MKVWLTGLGLALLGLFCVVAEGIDELDHEKAHGSWHVLGMASNSWDFLQCKEEMKVVVTTMSKTADGGLKFSSTFPTLYGCKTMEMVFREREDGKLVYASANDKVTINSIKTDYRNYMIITMDDWRSSNAVLYGRELELAPETVQDFINHAKELGFKEEQIKIKPKEVACTDME